MRAFTAENLAQACLEDGLLLPPHCVEQLVAAIDAGKHVILTGPPGTGKTTLAYLAADVARRSMFCTGFLPTTATSESGPSTASGDRTPTCLP